MRYLLPILSGLLVLGCSLPKTHDPNLTRQPRIPYPEDAPARGALSDGSLWQDRATFADLRAHNLNDLVTIRIAETTTATSKADVTTARSGSNNLNAPSLFSRLANAGVGSGAAATSGYTTSNTNKFAGNGVTDRSAVFTTTITARVVKVLGNGNLIFEGYRDIHLNNEKQRLYVAGMLDPARLDATNTIASAQVAELRVGYGGQGVVDETLKPGYISRLLAYIWPF
ncbi:flagellar basal body L-ring protein FlgH [Mesoterricola sediminis]|uniref:Flagellar L-ring protein n=1 Tax=Mesoterricola sediminis TaxID=2927980 RepID=A0AA48GQ47_9BACT|nr:flagellar basal body L-ring protein FlgH [Mesoterricola sediminis]BDU77201.1 flagellar L-ring protein [Mesoterricola sediminis]